MRLCSCYHATLVQGYFSVAYLHLFSKWRSNVSKPLPMKRSIFIHSFLKRPENFLRDPSHPHNRMCNMMCQKRLGKQLLKSSSQQPPATATILFLKPNPELGLISQSVSYFITQQIPRGKVRLRCFFCQNIVSILYITAKELITGFSAHWPISLFLSFLCILFPIVHCTAISIEIFLTEIASFYPAIIASAWTWRAEQNHSTIPA